MTKLILFAICVLMSAKENVELLLLVKTFLTPQIKMTDLECSARARARAHTHGIIDTHVHTHAAVT